MSALFTEMLRPSFRSTFIRDGAQGLPFISIWNTALTSTGSSASNQIKLPTVSGGTYNFLWELIDAGLNVVYSEKITTWDQAEVTATLPAVGVYTSVITGVFVGWQFNGSGDRNKLTEHFQCGILEPGLYEACWSGCNNMIWTAEDALNISKSTSMRLWFRDTFSMIGHESFNTWNTAHILNWEGIFFSSAFNTYIGDLNFTSLVNLFLAFRDCPYNHPDNWSLPNLANAGGAFFDASNYNQTISWVIPNVTNIFNMLSNTAMSTENWSNTLVNFAAQIGALQNNVTILSDATHNAAGAVAKAALETPNPGGPNWTVTDSGPV